MNESKQLLRTEMKSIRSRIEDREEKSLRICRHILELPEFRSADSVLLYAAIGSEVSLDALLLEAQRLRKLVLLPRCLDQGIMQAVPAHVGEKLTKGKYGIREPKGEAFPPERVDLVFCPGIAFDRSGGRLGWGKGYYDRYLPQTKALAVGVCFEACLVPVVPTDGQDVRMQKIVCETGIIQIGGIL